MRFYVWPKLTAFNDSTVGSKVVDKTGFFNALSEAVASFDFNAETNPKVTTTGQGKLRLDDAIHYVVSGVGRKSDSAADYVLREWRDEVKAFLRREYADPVTRLEVVVYTVDAYLADPDIDAEEAKRVRESEATHCIVAVLAHAGPEAPAYSPGRLVANLAGGNRDALAWNADEIREHARAAHEYASEWSVVAD